MSRARRGGGLEELRDAIQRFNSDHAILDLFGEQLNRAASTNGGEYAGACPLCGGEDRLRVWPDHHSGARAWCRRCERSGDTLAWAMRIAGVDPEEAGATVRWLRGEGYLPPADAPTTPGYPSAEAAARAFNRSGTEIEAVYDYGQAAAVVRLRPKSFRMIHRGYDGRWRAGSPAGLWPLYRLDRWPNGSTVFVCEGEKAADAIVSVGLAATTSAGGSSSAHRTDWAPLAGRRVVIVPDNDEPGEGYCQELLGLLSAVVPPPEVRVLRLPDLGPGGDAADYLAARQSQGATLDAVRAEVDAAVDDTEPERLETEPDGDSHSLPRLMDSGRYFADRRGTFRKRDDGVIQLANFRARIAGEAIRSDGFEEERVYDITLELETGERMQIPVNASRFRRMHWVERAGPRAIVTAGQSNVDALREAIMRFSAGHTTTVRQYSHTGWRTIGNDEVFLSAGASVGGSRSLPDATVSLAPPLDRYELPEPATGQSRIEAILATLRLADVAPDAVSLPLLAVIARAPLGPCDFAVHLFGKTGSFKTELATLVQRHYGTGFDARRLPASWESTANNLVELASLAKDVVMVIDDFNPRGTASEQAQWHAKADQVLRAAGNRSGRGRMRRDGSLMVARAPRGLILSTGEDCPRGHSLGARLLQVEVTPRAVNEQCLTTSQHDADSGHFAQCMAAYLEWLAPQIRGLQDNWKSVVAARRTEFATADLHRRTPGLLVEMLRALELFTQFAVNSRAIDAVERDQLLDRTRDALTEAGASQSRSQNHVDPGHRFLQLLASAISAGDAHIGSRSGDPPDCLLAPSLGWRQNGSLPMGSCVGWVDHDDLYLDVNAALRAANGVANQNPLPGGEAFVRRALRDAGLLASTDTTRNTLTVRRTIQQRRRDVVHLHLHSLFGDLEPDQPDQDTAETYS